MTDPTSRLGQDGPEIAPVGFDAAAPLGTAAGGRYPEAPTKALNG